MIVEIFLVTVALLLSLYYYATKDYDYWKKRGVKYIEPYFIFGNLFDIIFPQKTRVEFHQDVYKAAAGDQYIGMIQIRDPLLFIVSPDLLRNVLGKDFSHFHDRGFPFDEKTDKLAGHLFNLEGARWRNLRQKLTPTFTSGKMKNMFPFIEECSQEMVELLAPYAEREEVVEMREIFARYATDVIGTCAFGVQCNSLRNPDAEFRRMCATFMKPTKLVILYQVFSGTFPIIGRLLPRPAKLKKFTDFFYNTIQDTIQFREKNNVERRDFLDLLMQIKKKGHIVSNPEDLQNDAFIKSMGQYKIEDFEFTDSLLAAQAFVFFIAGFETSSTALSYAFIELSKNPEIQEKLRKEVDETFDRYGKFSYTAVTEMSYMDKVVSETLRMYPPVPLLFRRVTDAYKVPDSGLVLEKGIRIAIPVHSIHHDPKFYPDPESFDPERFSEEEKQKRHNYAYLPFGEGPRNCIGLRFGLMQVKLAMATILHKYQFELGPEMPYPPVFSNSAFLLTSAHGTHLRIKKRTPREITTAL